MKRMMSLVLAATTALSLTGCTFSVGGNTEPAAVQETAAQSQESAVNTETTAVDFPTEPVQIIVPFDAGGGADVAVRLLSKYAEEELGQTIVVNNVSGGSGTIGIMQLASSNPDGYTIGYFASTNSNDSQLFDGITYDEKSFEPICMMAADPHIIVASNKSGITDLDGLIAAAQEKPGQISFGLGGAWTSHDFLRLSIEENAEIEFKRMVYQGGAAAINAVAGGDCDIAVPFVSEALAQIEAGNVVPIAITSADRFELTPDIPTMKESGLDMEHSMWRGLVAPAGTPQENIDLLVHAFETAFNNEEYQKAALEAGTFAQFKGGEEFKSFYLENHDKYKEMIETMNTAE